MIGVLAVLGFQVKFRGGLNCPPNLWELKGFPTWKGLTQTRELANNGKPSLKNIPSKTLVKPSRGFLLTPVKEIPEWEPRPEFEEEAWDPKALGK